MKEGFTDVPSCKFGQQTLKWTRRESVKNDITGIRYDRTFEAEWKLNRSRNTIILQWILDEPKRFLNLQSALSTKDDVLEGTFERKCIGTNLKSRVLWKRKEKRKIRKEKKIVPAKSHASEAALLPQRSEATEADAFFPSPIEQRFCHHPQRSNCIRMGQSLWGERGCRTIWAHHPDEQDSTADPSSHSMNPAPVRSRTPPGSGPTGCNTGFWSSHSPVCWTWVVPFFKMGSISAQNPITQIGWWVNNKHSLITLSTIVLLFLSAYFLLQQWRRDLRGKQWGREITKRSMGVWLVARITIRLFVVY